MLVTTGSELQHELAQAKLHHDGALKEKELTVQNHSKLTVQHAELASQLAAASNNLGNHSIILTL